MSAEEYKRVCESELLITPFSVLAYISALEQENENLESTIKHRWECECEKDKIIEKLREDVKNLQRDK